MIDFAFAIVIVVFAVGGAFRGAAVSVFSIVIAFTGCMLGLMLGGILGAQELRFLFGAAGAVAGGVAFSFRLSAIVTAMRDWYPSDLVKWLDRSLGAISMAVVGATLTWVITVVVYESPAIGVGAREQFRVSRIATVVTDVAPPTGAMARLLVQSGIVPALRGPIIVVDPPDESLINTPIIHNATRSIVKISGVACGQRYTGTGWVAEHDTVVTNAHVVAGERQSFIELGENARDIPATVVAFDPVNDIAILRTPGLGLPALRINVAPVPATAAVIMGYPLRLGLTLTAARYDRTMKYAVHDIYNKPAGEVDIVIYRGKVLHGNSGSPIVDATGAALATVSSSAIAQLVDGGFAVPNIVPQRMISAAGIAPVSTGPCTA